MQERRDTKKIKELRSRNTPRGERDPQAQVNSPQRVGIKKGKKLRREKMEITWRKETEKVEGT